MQVGAPCINSASDTALLCRHDANKERTDWPFHVMHVFLKKYNAVTPCGTDASCSMEWSKSINTCHCPFSMHSRWFAVFAERKNRMLGCWLSAVSAERYMAKLERVTNTMCAFSPSTGITHVVALAETVIADVCDVLVAWVV